MSQEFTLFSFALRNLKRKVFRTVVLIAAIGLLVSAFVFVLSFIRRVDTTIKVTSERLGADIMIVPSGSRGAAEDILLENRVKTFYMDKGFLQKISTIEGIDRVTSQTYLASITGECCDVPETVVVAFNQDSDFIIKPWLGEKLGKRLRKGEALVGNESAMNISVGLTEVDGVLFGNIFKMVGVLDKTGTGLDTAIFIDEENIENILTKGKAALKPDQISIIFARVKKGYDPSKVAGLIEDSFIEVDAVARKDIGKSLIEALKDINQIFLMTVILASVLSVFLVGTVFSAIANERAKEVGIMRAIGATEAHVMKIFFLEVAVVGSIGSIIGITAGTGLSILLAKNFAILKNLSSDLTAVQRLSIALICFMAGTGICVAGALVPIRRIKKMEPLMAIKEE